MTDEDKKKIVSEPPPPTDEIDGEWGDDDQTLIRGVPEGLSPSQPAPASAAPVTGSTPPKAAASTPPKAVASSTPPKAAEASTPPEMKAAAPVASEDEEEDEDEDDEEEDDEEATDNEDDAVDEEEDDEEEDDHHVGPPAGATAPGADWLPDWAPFAVLAGLVGASIVFGLGLVGGPAASAEENEAAAEPAASVKAPVKASPHP